MTVIGYFILGLIIVVVVTYLFSLIRKVIIIAAFFSGIYLIFFTDYLVLGCLALVVWLVLAYVSERSEVSFSDSNKKGIYSANNRKRDEGFFSSTKSASRSSKRNTVSKGGANWNYILMWLIPLFWPVLIFRTFFRDKQAGKLDAYDYEQHLKSNAKN